VTTRVVQERVDPSNDLVRVCPYCLSHLSWVYSQGDSYDLGAPICPEHKHLRSWLVANVAMGTIVAVGHVRLLGRVLEAPVAARERPNATKRWLLHRGRRSKWLGLSDLGSP